MNEDASELAGALRTSLLDAGFARVGFARAERPMPEAEALADFVARGDHGTMGWLARSLEVRSDPAHPDMVPEARTVIVAAAAIGEAPIDLQPGRIARFARGRDYHRALEKALRPAVRRLRDAGFRARNAIDSKPLLERAFATRAGVGFVGKNGMLIVPGLGSHVLLACIVTTAWLPSDAPIDEGCGACRACLDRCPTDAFRGPRALDARRCISYHTIEHEGPEDAALRARREDWLFGCDLCQDVCPYNLGRARRVAPMPLLADDGRFEGLTAADLLTLDEAEFAARFTGNPFARAGRNRLARNAATVLGHAGDRIHLPVLRAACDDTRADVADAARAGLDALEARLGSR